MDQKTVNVGQAHLRAARLEESPDVLTASERMEAHHDLLSLSDHLTRYARMVNPAVNLPATRERLTANLLTFERWLTSLRDRYGLEAENTDEDH